ncbi:hypothetical protein HZB02_02250 [Candidatus Woesearchaeota archaeon]|nr:hypothetical protein [Candidatus Woesearchaeota archaeon]
MSLLAQNLSDAVDRMLIDFLNTKVHTSKPQYAITADDLRLLEKDLADLVKASSSPKHFPWVRENFQEKYGPNLEFHNNGFWTLVFPSSFNMENPDKPDLRNHFRENLMSLYRERETTVTQLARGSERTFDDFYLPIIKTSDTGTEVPAADRSRSGMFVAGMNFRNHRSLSSHIDISYDTPTRSIDRLTAEDLTSRIGVVHEMIAVYTLMGGYKKAINVRDPQQPWKQQMSPSLTPPLESLSPSLDLDPPAADELNIHRLEDLSYNVMRYGEIDSLMLRLFFKAKHVDPDEIFTQIIYQPQDEAVARVIGIVPTNKNRLALVNQNVFSPEHITLLPAYNYLYYQGDQAVMRTRNLITSVVRKSIPSTAEQLRKGLGAPVRTTTRYQLDAVLVPEPNPEDLATQSVRIADVSPRYQLLLASFGLGDDAFYTIYDHKRKLPDGTVAVIPDSYNRLMLLQQSQQAVIAFNPPYQVHYEHNLAPIRAAVDRKRSR